MSGTFVSEFLAYLRARKWLWLFPIVAIGLLLIMIAALLFGPGVALEAFYQIF
jgi:ABC-type dipeptide/oligopeptide/nickel transport system permease subunit